MKILPVPSEKYFRKGYLEFQKGNFEKARAHFEKSLNLNPKNDMASFFLGIVKLEKGEADASRAHFESTVKTDPGFYASHVALGIAFAEKWVGSIETGAPDKLSLERAILAYENAVALNHDDHDVKNFLQFLKDSRK